MRITFLADDELVDKLDFEAKRLHISRSAYIVMTLAQKLQAEKTVDDLSKLIDIYQSEKNK